VREDPHRKGLLYCGTETGMYCSMDNGQSWQGLQFNLPVTPIHDIAVHAREKDLVVATHGRSFWILDDLTPLHQLADSIRRAPLSLLTPRPTYLIGNGSYVSKTMSEGTNAPSGVQLTYWLRDSVRGELTLEIVDQKDSVIRRFSNLKTDTGDDRKPNTETFESVPERRSGSVLPTRTGMNRFTWDMNLKGVSKVNDAVYWFGGPGGISVPPGRYRAVLRSGNESAGTSFVIVKDPRLETTDGDFEQQYDLGSRIVEKAERVNTTINAIAELSRQVTAWEARARDAADSATAAKVKVLAASINDSLSRIEKA
ncbi:MAG: glycosyl hydrolase, partial [Candidatus Kapaibacterium sp.]